MVALLLCMLVAAGTTGVAQDTAVPAEAKAAIAAANDAWLPALKARDAAAIAEPYADDGIFVTPTGAVVKGREGVAQLMRDRFAQIGKVTGGTLVQDGLTRAGALIYEWGHAIVESERGAGPPSRSRGRYLTVWQQKNGRWEIIRNLSLPD